MAIGRNDPCPCGSGKKYKKCCYKKDGIDKRVAERSKHPDEELPPEATIYAVWLQWRAARARSDFNFLFDLIEPGTSLAQQAGARDAFIANCVEGTAAIPSGESAGFRHLSIVDSARAALLQTLGDDDPALSKVRCERLSFEKAERGWRFAGFDVVEVEKEGGVEIGLGIFG